MLQLVVTLVVGTIALNVWATRQLHREAAYLERHQYVAQLLVVWLIPIAGSILVGSLHSVARASPYSGGAGQTAGDSCGD